MPTALKMSRAAVPPALTRSRRQHGFCVDGRELFGRGAVATTASLNFGDLTPGAQYSLRYYYRQWDAGDSPTRPVQFVFNGNGSNATFQTDEDIGGAYYIEYDFTAVNNTVSLY